MSKPSNYIEFNANFDDLKADLTPEEIEEMEVIEADYKKRSSILEEKISKMEAAKESENIIHDKYKELFDVMEDYNKKRGIFYNKIQERRFTQTIKNVGIEKFFTDRIKLAEEAITSKS
ncbi:MAG: hypothetical protein ACOYJ1_10245, partial [Peptococcales bacterium]